MEDVQADVSIVDAPEVALIKFKVQYGKAAVEVEKPATTTVGELKQEVENTLSIPPQYQKLMYKGMLKNDEDTLEKVGLKQNAKILLIATNPSDIQAAKENSKTGGAATQDMAWDKPNEPLSKQQPHAKIIAKGKPEEAWAGVKDRQVPLADTQTYIPGLLNSQGTKVRLTFKPDIQQIWIGSAASTQKVAFGMISKIESWPIDGQEEYSIVAFNVGHGASSKYWIYYVPSQHVAAIKLRILGVQALI